MSKPIDFDMARMKRNDPELFEHITSIFESCGRDFLSFHEKRIELSVTSHEALFEGPAMEKVQKLSETFIWSLVALGSSGVTMCCPIGDKHMAYLNVEFKDTTAPEASDPTTNVSSK